MNRYHYKSTNYYCYYYYYYDYQRRGGLGSYGSAQEPSFFSKCESPPEIVISALATGTPRGRRANVHTNMHA